MRTAATTKRGIAGGGTARTRARSRIASPSNSRRHDRSLLDNLKQVTRIRNHEYPDTMRHGSHESGSVFSLSPTDSSSLREIPGEPYDLHSHGVISSDCLETEVFDLATDHISWDSSKALGGPCVIGESGQLILDSYDQASYDSVRHHIEVPEERIQTSDTSTSPGSVSTQGTEWNLEPTSTSTMIFRPERNLEDLMDCSDSEQNQLIELAYKSREWEKPPWLLTPPVVAHVLGTPSSSPRSDDNTQLKEQSTMLYKEAKLDYFQPLEAEHGQFTLEPSIMDWYGDNAAYGDWTIYESLESSKVEDRIPRTADHGTKDGRQSKLGSSTLEGHRSGLLACPFYKLDCQRYGDCFRYELRRIKDVKQHLKRKHLQPQFYCARCYATFPDTEHRDAHMRADSCEINEHKPCFDGLSELQRQKLSQYNSKEKTIPQQWFDMWDIIFGGAFEQPSSCFLGNYLEQPMAQLERHWLEQKLDILSAVAMKMGRKVTVEDMSFFHAIMTTLLGSYRSGGNTAFAETPRDTQNLSDANRQQTKTHGDCDEFLGEIPALYVSTPSNSVEEAVRCAGTMDDTTGSYLAEFDFLKGDEHARHAGQLAIEGAGACFDLVDLPAHLEV